MQLNSRISMNNAGIPVLSFKSGHQLITEVAQKPAAAFSDKNHNQPYSYHKLQTNQQNKASSVYQFSGDKLVNMNNTYKGTHLNAIA
ncbi:hypothetical protein L3V77_24545 [Vibrio sp. DW001]|uniref:hypothetical protein n=1 Tax=Vibrio sp. DW001 TaxID=2912315 RepID=UPI0023B0DC5D|nr:hypothetical protein [Vibrio sp. DW001]WED29102.1 hypothetical protein L3V77_24545 [Vibrio sp. DW001]